jgi:hypothetical protein
VERDGCGQRVGCALIHWERVSRGYCGLPAPSGIFVL